jgi:hypothetical protein
MAQGGQFWVITTPFFWSIFDYHNQLFQSGVGGSIITVANLQRITVLDHTGKTIYTYNDRSVVPTAITPLLLGN